ncbi:hypothetical protein L1049_023152 [Liquidambar formosana]|uniref:Uncharacterized protein n=1 Tax=Liquidambar formosana TaxID=63359 RepID=A0AAP0RFN7_LIQFO
MGSWSEEEDQFFDTREEVSDLGSDFSEDCSSASAQVDCVSNSFWHEFWTKSPACVHERRHKFFKWMGLSLDQNSVEIEESRDIFYEKVELEIDRITENGGAVLRASDFEDEFSSSRSCLSNEAMELVEDGALEENFVCKIRNLDDGTEFVFDEMDRDGMLSRLREVGSNQSVTIEEFQRALGSSPSVLQLLRRGDEVANKLVVMKKKVKKSWLRRLGSMACIADGQGEAELKPHYYNPTIGAMNRRVRVHPTRKRSKELSSLFTGQEFPAHEGSILTMKFSLDGQYLASAGEDGVVRVWKVIEVERSNEFDMSDVDSSSLYFTVNPLSKLAPLNVDKEKIGKMKKLRRSSDSACVILPPKVFRISEKPLHEFRGHSGEVLDLSWSKKGYLLSSSVDKTVRLWQVGCDRCLRIFSHNNYVTCVNFNPVNDNYFISGSIDGKVRIWEVLGCRVVDWTDVREIVTAVCYHPNGEGGIVGFMTGNCRFYDIIDNHLELGAQICLQGKKKLPRKRITGFEFSPCDPSKVMVTSADSVVRILCGVDVICKFKGLRNAGSQISASFTSDGKHIVSASEDSNVYVWNYTSQDRTSSRVKNIWSSESFLSHNASIALPWGGMKTMSATLPSPTFVGRMPGISFKKGQEGHHFDENSHHKMPFSSPDCFPLSRGFLLESLPKGTATWPEEKLPSPMALSPTMCKSEYKFLKSAWQSTISSPHMWGLVIVTAGWDGRIRTYQNYGLPIRL